jgi:phospholipid/cholesterol/gamma-HCH transport system substrate-binding protein
MAKRRTKFFVGLFMAVGISIALVAIIWLGMSKFLEKGNRYAIYFDESVQGLSVDSPVKYRGVAIGRVEWIRVAADSRLIEVVIIIETDLKPEDDMVAQLKVVGITGSMFIELDRVKDDLAFSSPKLNFPTEYPVLVSRPSDISELFRGIDQIVQKINALDIAGISDRIKTTLDQLNKSVTDADLAEISDSIQKVLKNINQTVVDLDTRTISADIKTVIANANENLDPGKWEKVIGGIEEAVLSVDKVINNTNQVLDNTKILLTNAAGVVDETESGIVQLNRHLLVVGQELEQASGNLNRMLDQLAEQPSQLLFGEPPPRRLPAQ